MKKDKRYIVLYLLITEELFNKEMTPIPNSPLVVHFIYEEFHPDR